MRSDRKGALAYRALTEPNRGTEVDDELDLLADENICPTCGSFLLECEDDVLLLECPICDRHLR
jgi:hypothetical protein